MSRRHIFDQAAMIIGQVADGFDVSVSNEGNVAPSRPSMTEATRRLTRDFRQFVHLRHRIGNQTTSACLHSTLTQPFGYMQYVDSGFARRLTGYTSSKDRPPHGRPGGFSLFVGQTITTTRLRLNTPTGVAPRSPLDRSYSPCRVKTKIRRL